MVRGGLGGGGGRGQGVCTMYQTRFLEEKRNRCVSAPFCIHDWRENYLN